MKTTLAYRETKTGDRYRIRYEQDQSGIWRIYAESHPHNPFCTLVTSCHLYASGEVCVDHRKFAPRRLDQAKACAVMWIEGYSQYVRNGVFPATGGRVRV